MEDGTLMVVWCPSRSKTARDLAQGLGWMRCKKRLPPFVEGGLLLQPLATGLPMGATWMNSRMCWDKLTQHHVLRGAGIPTLDVLPYPPDDTWVGRTRRHAGGGDFLQTIEPDYFTRKVSVEKEFRFHIIGGRSVKAGGKIPHPTEEHHPWVRARQFGWVVDYGPEGREGITPPMREMAKAAALSLQMDAGAVDVWLLSDGGILVGEVNVRPGMDGPTVLAWVEGVRRFYADGE